MTKTVTSNSGIENLHCFVSKETVNNCIRQNIPSRLVQVAYTIHSWEQKVDKWLIWRFHMFMNGNPLSINGSYS
jgi:hypothetical protein